MNTQKNTIQKNAHVGLVSFIMGLAVFGTHNVAFSGDSFPTPNEPVYSDNPVAPKLHELNIQGGFNDSDNAGITIENTGRLAINVESLTGGLFEYGYDLISNKAGIDVTALHLPLAGKNQLNINGNQYGRMGVQGMISALNSVTGNTETVRGVVGFLRSNNAFENYPTLSHLPISAGEPYAFYALQGDTKLAETYVDGFVSNPDGALDLYDNVYVADNITIDDQPSDPSDKTLILDEHLEFQSGSPYVNRFGIMHNSLNSAATTPAANSGQFSVAVSCPPESYVIDCSGYVDGAPSYAPYKGSYHWYKSNGQSCSAKARKTFTGNVTLHAYAYCFAPHENVPNFDIY